VARHPVDAPSPTKHSERGLELRIGAGRRRLRVELETRIGIAE
jgi:hypothetical protein